MLFILPFISAVVCLEKYGKRVSLSESTGTFDNWIEANRYHSSTFMDQADLREQYHLHLRRSLEEESVEVLNSTLLTDLLMERQKFFEKLNAASSVNDQRRLVEDLLDPQYYERNVHPRKDYLRPTSINVSMSLYQILEVDEHMQSITVNVWMVQSWYDEFLDWDPRKYGMINKTIVPYNQIWIPDTYLYNSETLEAKKTESKMNAILETGFWANNSMGARVQFMFPAIYKLSCAMNDGTPKSFSTFKHLKVIPSLLKADLPTQIRAGSYCDDLPEATGYLVCENCRALFVSSGGHLQRHIDDCYGDTSTHPCKIAKLDGNANRSNSTLDDYWPTRTTVNLQNMARNDEWDVLSFDFHRIEQNFKCCKDPWVMLYAHMVMKRKPLYYIVNLVIPTSIITIVAVTGFFTPSSSSCERDEKLYLGINTLLTMSIMMLMVCNQMPSTSTYVPLMSWYYIGIIGVIVIGTLLATIVLESLPKHIIRCNSQNFKNNAFADVILDIPTSLMELWTEFGIAMDAREEIDPFLEKALDPVSLFPPRPRAFFGSISSELESDHNSLAYTARLANLTRQYTVQVRKRDRECRKSIFQSNTSHAQSVRKQKMIRRCNLEWELLSNILDRIFLTLFCFTTFVMFVWLVAFDRFSPYFLHWFD